MSRPEQFLVLLDHSVISEQFTIGYKRSMRLSHIEIIGGVGSGKTTLGKCLAENGFTLVEEEFKANPFLEAVHKEPFSCTYEFGMTMLMMHYNRLNKQAPVTPKPVFDFSLVTNEGYARSYIAFGRLKPELGEVYIRAVQVSRQQAARPAMRIYLNIEPEEQLRRIHRRGRPLETKTSLDFLHTLKTNLHEVVSTLNDGVPLLTIDAAAHNLADSDDDKRMIAGLVSQTMNEISAAKARSVLIQPRLP